MSFTLSVTVKPKAVKDCLFPYWDNVWWMCEGNKDSLEDLQKGLKELKSHVNSDMQLKGVKFKDVSIHVNFV